MNERQQQRVEECRPFVKEIVALLLDEPDNWKMDGSIIRHAGTKIGLGTARVFLSGNDVELTPNEAILLNEIKDDLIARWTIKCENELMDVIKSYKQEAA